MTSQGQPNPNRIFSFDCGWGVVDCFAVSITDAREYMKTTNPGAKYKGVGPMGKMGATTEKRSLEIREKNRKMFEEVSNEEESN